MLTLGELFYLSYVILLTLMLCVLMLCVLSEFVGCCEREKDARFSMGRLKKLCEIRASAVNESVLELQSLPWPNRCVEGSQCLVVCIMGSDGSREGWSLGPTKK